MWLVGKYSPCSRMENKLAGHHALSEEKQVRVRMPSKDLPCGLKGTVGGAGRRRLPGKPALVAARLPPQARLSTNLARHQPGANTNPVPGLSQLPPCEQLQSLKGPRHITLHTVLAPDWCLGRQQLLETQGMKLKTVELNQHWRKWFQRTPGTHLVPGIPKLQLGGVARAVGACKPAERCVCMQKFGWVGGWAGGGAHACPDACRQAGKCRVQVARAQARPPGAIAPAAPPLPCARGGAPGAARLDDVGVEHVGPEAVAC